MRRLTRDPAELLPLKHSTYQVLLALGDGEAMHGYAIMQAVSAMTDGREAILPGTLYAALARMVDEGLVTESTPKDDASGGPARRYYQRTRFGRAGPPLASSFGIDSVTRPSSTILASAA